MEQSYLARAAKYVTAQRKRQNWQKVVSGLCAVVVFCTVYALILPAITLTAPLTCGLEEHQHDESCYGTSGSVQLVWQQVCSEESVYADVKEEERYAPFVLHVHDDLCYRDGSLICTFEEVPPHIHNEECWIDVLDDLICGLEETPGGAGHVHASDCYAGVLVCGQEESAPIEGHIHDESCYTTETIPGALICENTGEDHQHDESCYSAATETSYLSCGQEESASAEGHTHTSGCYEMQLVCGLEEGEAESGHVHTEECYASKERVELCFDPKIAHEHIPLRFNEYGEAINADAACYDAYGVLTCTKWVTREHVHTEACFQEVEDAAVEPEQVLTCEITEHTHDESCYGQEELGEPEEPEEPVRQDEQWDAIFWSGVVSGSSDVVLDAWTNGSWMDTGSMDPELLAQLHAAGEADLTRALQSAAIQVGSQAYDSALHGPMDPGRDFSIMLTWSLNSNSFTGMTYSYQFPWQISVENVEKRVLNDSDGNQALTYSVWNNVLTVTYYAPAESVTTGFSLRASWSGDMGADTVIQWSRSDSTYVVFAEPELTVEKAMGEDGLRVAEDGTVWADYTVTVTNSGMVAAGDITLTDVLEAERFHFAQGAYENGADYIVTANGGDGCEAFPDYDGGDTVTFPAFDLEPGESRVFQYMAVMSAEDRAAVDAAVKASGDPTQAGETVRNTATAVCRAFSGDLEFTSTSRATYGGPDSKHVENFTQVYETGAFNVSFTVNGDAQLPLGMTAEKLERTAGEGLRLTVETLDEATEEYQAFAQSVEEDAELLDLQVLQLGLNYNGAKLDLEDCDVTATVTPTEALLNYQKPHVADYSLPDEEKEAEEPLGDEGFGIVLKAFSQNAEAGTVVEPEAGFAADSADVPAVAGMVEEGSIYIDRNDDPEVEQAAIAPITFSMENEMLAVQALVEDYWAYNVEFYGNIKLLDVIPGTDDSKDPAKDLSIIDTRTLGRTPLNSDGIHNNSRDKIAFLELESDGTVKSTSVEKQLFTGKTVKFDPQKDLNLGMFLILEQFAQSGNAELDPTGETNYTLNTAIIIPKGQTEEYAKANGGEIKLDGRSPSDIHLTTDPAQVGGNTYLISRDATIKLICDPTSSENYTAPVVFYDYDISDGYIYDVNGNKSSVSVQATNPNAVWYAYTNRQGINSSSNYGGATSGLLAFGNDNTKTGLGSQQFGSTNFNINKANVENFRKCTFGLVTGLSNGIIQYAPGITAPKLFNESDSVTGKTVYQSGYRLMFKREGDTYTMAAVQKDGVSLPSASNLDKLQDTRAAWYSDSDAKKYGRFYMFSNCFWPMDGVASHGTDGHDFKFGAGNKVGNRYTFDNLQNMKGSASTTPVIDDSEPTSGSALGPNVDHNSYFGMQFKMEFTIPEGYVGPLEYCFHGDDDLWLFLDETLVCDIGGVHQSAGQYVDLRQYLPVDGNNTVGTHTLTLFYTERGASGSTCWMQFTLPGLRSVPVDVIPGDKTGNLRIQKKVEGTLDTGTPFGFTLKLGGNVGTNAEYVYELADGNGEVVETGKVSGTGDFGFQLKANESLVVRNLPEGATYTIIETGDDRNSYETEMTVSKNGGPDEPFVSNTDRRTVRGKISGNTSVLVTYTNTFYYALPETGGAGSSGTAWYTMGALPVMAAAVLVYKRTRKKGGTEF